MQAGEQAGPRWRADSCSGIASCEAHPVGGEAVDVGSVEFFLTIAADISVPEVVGKDEYYVWSARLFRLASCDCCAAEGHSCYHQSFSHCLSVHLRYKINEYIAENPKHFYFC